MKYLIFITYARDTQIYTGDPDETDNDSEDFIYDEKWEDFDGDILLNIVSADSPEKAVKKAAKASGLSKNVLLAVPVEDDTVKKLKKFVGTYKKEMKENEKASVNEEPDMQSYYSGYNQALSEVIVDIQTLIK